MTRQQTGVMWPGYLKKKKVSLDNKQTNKGKCYSHQMSADVILQFHSLSYICSSVLDFVCALVFCVLCPFFCVCVSTNQVSKAECAITACWLADWSTPRPCDWLQPGPLTTNGARWQQSGRQQAPFPRPPRPPRPPSSRRFCSTILFWVS